MALDVFSVRGFVLISSYSQSGCWNVSNSGSMFDRMAETTDVAGRMRVRKSL